MQQALVTRPNGYLLKPFDADDLYAAIEVAMSNFNGSASNNSDDSALLCKDALFIKTDKNFVRVEINDICWVESEHNYLYIVSQKGNSSAQIVHDQLG